MESFIYIFGQILGIIAIGLGFLSYQMRSQKNVLLLQVITAAVFIVHYLMIGAVSGMALNVVNLLKNIVYFFRSKKDSHDKIIPAIFVILFAVVGIFTWEAWYSVFVYVGLIIHAIGFALSDAQKSRGSILISSPLVMLYNVFAQSYGGIVYEAVATVSAAIGLIRYRKQKSAAAQESAEPV